jgi:hypothetical protein
LIWSEESIIQQVAEKGPYASLRSNRLTATYCKYVSACRFSRALPLALFEQPARGFLASGKINRKKD